MTYPTTFEKWKAESQRKIAVLDDMIKMLQTMRDAEMMSSYWPGPEDRENEAYKPAAVQDDIQSVLYVDIGMDKERDRD